MRETKIEWCRHTFNPWWGCVKVSPGCTNCYAEAFDRRTHGTERHTDARGVVREPHWGKDAPRRFFGDAHWRQPIAWNRAAEKAGERHRVFCASMADVFEDRPDLVGPRFRLMNLVWQTQQLDWLLLTKRPENIGRMLVEAAAWGRANTSLNHIALHEWGEGHGKPFPNVWLGTTVENQEQADRRIPHLLRVPVAVRFLSVEPLLGPVDLRHIVLPDSDGTLDALSGDWGRTLKIVGGPRIDWVIVGGESGPGARPCDVAWIRSVVMQCREAGVPCFVKQDSGRLPGQQGRIPADLWIKEFPDARS